MIFFNIAYLGIYAEFLHRSNLAFKRQHPNDISRQSSPTTDRILAGIEKYDSKDDEEAAMSSGQMLQEDFGGEDINLDNQINSNEIEMRGKSAEFEFTQYNPSDKIEGYSPMNRNEVSANSEQNFGALMNAECSNNNSRAKCSQNVMKSVKSYDI